MLNFIDISLLKNKFGKVISKAYHEANLDLDNISRGIIDTPYFDIFEQNKIESFMLDSSEKIIEDIFGNINIREYVDDVGPLFWSGIQYMNIYLNTLVPLNTLFLLFPLKEMVSLYDVYHEMNEIKIVEYFNVNRRNNSILKILRKRKGYSIRELSIITDIPEGTLKSYENDNSTLFNASYQNIQKLSNILNTQSIIFKKRSSFVPLSYSIIKENAEFRSIFIELIKEYYNIQNTSLDLVIYENNVGMNTINISEPTTILLNNKKIIISDDELLKLFRIVIQKILSIDRKELYL